MGSVQTDRRGAEKEGANRSSFFSLIVTISIGEISKRSPFPPKSARKLSNVVDFKWRSHDGSGIYIVQLICWSFSVASRGKREIKPHK